MIRIAMATALAWLLVGPEADAQAPAAPEGRVRKLTIGGDGGWDYLTVDAEARRLYVSRSTRVVVLDLDNETVVGELPDTPGVHGVAIVPDLARGFTSNGGDDTVTAFDTKTLKALGVIKVGGRPDAIFFEPASRRVFTYNHGSKDATAIDPDAMKVVGAVPLDGVPEAAVSDDKGHVFVNIMDKGEIVEFDARTNAVLERRSLSPGERPTGLGFDREGRTLFSVCGNQKMIVVDADGGKVLDALTIGRGSDGAGFDPESGLAFSSNGGDGTLSVVRKGADGHYAVVATIPTQAGARTMAIDPKTHRVYLATATPAPAPAGQPPAKGRGRNYVPGSFAVLVVELAPGK